MKTLVIDCATEACSVALFDGDALIATHYCAQGNQPRLKLTPGQGARIRFTFRDATDLAPGESHLHDLAFDLSAPSAPPSTPPSPPET